MRKFSILIVFVLGIMSLSSCLKDDNTINPNTSYISVANLYPSEGGIYLREVQNYSGIYKSIAAYLSIPGNKNIRIYDRMNNSVLIDTTLSYADSLAYSGYLYGEPGKPKFVRSNDVGIKDLNTKSAARFFHFANGTEKVSFYIGEQTHTALQNRTRETGESMKTSEVFHPFTAGSYTIIAKDQEGKVIATKESVFLKAGTYQNFVLIGTKGNANFPLEIGMTTYQ